MKVFIDGFSDIGQNYKYSIRLLLNRALLSAFLCGCLTNATALTLKEAESIALIADPLVESFKAKARSFDNASVADNTLPDPKLRFGVANAPVDTFDLKQEQMTQVKLGIQQYFPRGDTLDLKREKSQWMANVSLFEAEDARRKLANNVRETYLNLYYEIAAHQQVIEARKFFAKLVKITESNYASGRVNQQDVVLANLELSRLDDRATRIKAKEEGFRAELAQWIGEAAWGSLESSFPILPTLPDSVDLNDVISNHPLIKSKSAKVEASKKSADLARQDYKPGWSATLDYGFRSGDNPNGTERTDLATAMVSLDIPLFTSNRQDKSVAASEQKTAAEKYIKDDELRKLKRMYEKDQHLWERLGEREKLYRDSLISSAKNNTEASLLAYQSGVTEFNTLMRAQITELDVRLDDLRIRVDRAAAQARLLYITGEPGNE